jgi:hypothetical protein
VSTPSRITFPTAFEIAVLAAALKLQPTNLGAHVTYASVCKQALTLLRTAQGIVAAEQAALEATSNG